MIALLTACTIEVDIGDDCRLVEVSEVLTANTYDPLPVVGDSDFFEIHNRDGQNAVNLKGYRFHGTQSLQPEFLVEEDCWIEKEGYQPFLATTYDDAPASCPDPPTTLFDFNNDGESLYVWGPSGRLCEVVDIPDQHWDVSWQRNPDFPDEWCEASEASPDESNKPCLCDVSDGC